MAIKASKTTKLNVPALLATVEGQILADAVGAENKPLLAVLADQLEETNPGFNGSHLRHLAGINPTPTVSTHAGEVGERKEWVGFFSWTKGYGGFSSRYGNRYPYRRPFTAAPNRFLIKMTTLEGQVLVYWSDRALPEECRDRPVLLTGTIKKLDAFRGEAQTELCRPVVKRLDVVAAELQAKKSLPRTRKTKKASEPVAETVVAGEMTQAV